MEGSTDVQGGITVVHLLRRTSEGLSREALLFHTDFHQGFAPLLFRDWLPRDLRRRVQPDEPIHDFFAAWTRGLEEGARARRVGAPERLPGERTPAVRGLRPREHGAVAAGARLPAVAAPGRSASSPLISSGRPQPGRGLGSASPREDAILRMKLARGSEIHPHSSQKGA